MPLSRLLLNLDSDSDEVSCDSDMALPHGFGERLWKRKFEPRDGTLLRNDKWSEKSSLCSDDFNLQGRTLGFGVDKGVDKRTGAPVAVKTFRVDNEAECGRLLVEAMRLAQNEVCPNLVRCHGAFSSGTIVRIVTEFMDLGSLADLKERILKDGGTGVPASMLACISRQIVTGLEQLHSRRFLHYDISPEHILHNAAGEVKILDSQCSKPLYVGVIVGPLTTYMSPEKCLGEEYSYATDVWSVGMVVYELACGHYPFAHVADSFPALFECICDKPEPRLDATVFPPELCDFVGGCLTRDVAHRSNTSMLSRHPFAASEPVNVLTAFIDLGPANCGVLVTCRDLGGNVKLQATLEADINMERLELYLRANFAGYKQMFDESGSIPCAQRLITEYAPSLTFTVANSALAAYLADLEVLH